MYVGFLYLNNINAIPNLPEFPSFFQSGIFEKKGTTNIEDKDDNNIVNTYGGIQTNPSSFLGPPKEIYGEQIISAIKSEEEVQNNDNYVPISPFLEPPETTTKPVFGQIIDFGAPVRKHPVYKVPPPLAAYHFNPSSLDQNIIVERDEAQ